MKALSFTEAQKPLILKLENEGTPVAAFCRKAGIQSSDLLQLEKQYGESRLRASRQRRCSKH